MHKLNRAGNNKLPIDGIKTAPGTKTTILNPFSCLLSSQSLHYKDYFILHELFCCRALRQSYCLCLKGFLTKVFLAFAAQHQTNSKIETAFFYYKQEMKTWDYLTSQIHNQQQLKVIKFKFPEAENNDRLYLFLSMVFFEWTCSCNHKWYMISCGLALQKRGVTWWAVECLGSQRRPSKRMHHDLQMSSKDIEKKGDSYEQFVSSLHLWKNILIIIMLYYSRSQNTKSASEWTDFVSD